MIAQASKLAVADFQRHLLADEEEAAASFLVPKTSSSGHRTAGTVGGRPAQSALTKTAGLKTAGSNVKRVTTVDN